MDDDYAAGSSLDVDAMTGGRTCPPGMILRRASRRSKASCIRDRGAKGRWQTVRRSKGIGPLKKGDLTAFGYSHTKPTAERHGALARAVAAYGRASTIRKLNAIAVYSKRTAPGRSATYTRDMHYVQKKFA